MDLQLLLPIKSAATKHYKRRRRNRLNWILAIILLTIITFVSISRFVDNSIRERNERETIELLDQMKFFQESLLRREQLLNKWKDIDISKKNRQRMHRFNNRRFIKVPPISSQEGYRRICYYTVPLNDTADKNNDLSLLKVNGTICTHINIGCTHLDQNHTIVINENVHQCLSKDLPQLRQSFPAIKFLLWIGGGNWNSFGFHSMIQNHTNRKMFLKSLKLILTKYHLDGCDLDWEFPTAYNRDRQHFSQLLYEIRAEYKRERRPYILSVAVAAIETISYFAYDISMINKYADHVNLMTYDYHAYTKLTPYTGLNAPLYARSMEHSFLATLNINYSVNWWISNGLDRRKLILGLPTYGHTFKLVNPLNKNIGSPAVDVGDCGELGFATYGDICWFKQTNVGVQEYFDRQSCSPYLSGGLEWISFENPESIHCKIDYIKEMNLGGAMLFSLNSDDYLGICNWKIKFPLGQMMINKLKG